MTTTFFTTLSTIVVALLLDATFIGTSAALEEEPYIIHTYHVEIIPTSDMYDVSGFAVLFTTHDADNDASEAETESSYVGYTGKLNDIESNLTLASCTKVNGCGVHVHSGTSCESNVTQGGHYYNNATIDKDPWTDVRYFTNDDGSSSSFAGLIDIGSTDIDGRVFLVHSASGARIGCGVIKKITDNGILATVTDELSVSGVTGQVSLYSLKDGVVCYFGVATSLERDLVSYLNPNPFVTGNDCNFTNGCGVHIHNGTSCTDNTTQGGHFYGDNVEIDPWLYTMYYETDDDGEAYYTGCVETGISDTSSYSDRPFIVHSNNGTRVSCGMLQGSAGVPSSPSMPSPSMPSPPTPTMPSNSAAIASVVVTVVSLILPCAVSCLLF